MTYNCPHGPASLLIGANIHTSPEDPSETEMISEIWSTSSIVDLSVNYHRQCNVHRLPTMATTIPDIRLLNAPIG